MNKKFKLLVINYKIYKLHGSSVHNRERANVVIMLHGDRWLLDLTVWTHHKECTVDVTLLFRTPERNILCVNYILTKNLEKKKDLVLSVVLKAFINLLLGTHLIPNYPHSTHLAPWKLYCSSIPQSSLYIPALALLFILPNV